MAKRRYGYRTVVTEGTIEIDQEKREAKMDGIRRPYDLVRHVVLNYVTVALQGGEPTLILEMWELD